MNKNIDLIHIENNVGSSTKRYLDLTKMKKLINFKANIKLDEGLVLTYN